MSMFTRENGALLAEAVPVAEIAQHYGTPTFVYSRAALEQARLLDQALFAQRVGWPDQWVAPARAVPDDLKPYFSLLLVRQIWPEVLP